MSNYDDIRDDLSALIDGALDPDRQREVEAALQNDPALRAEYERLVKIDGLYAELPREAAPAGFAEGVRGAIARRENPADTRQAPAPVKLRMFTRAARRSVFWPLAAAATLAVGFFLWTTVDRANRSGMMLSMTKAAPAGTAEDAKEKDEQLYKARVMPADAAKAEAPAISPAPAAAPAVPVPAPEPAAPARESAEKKADAARNTPPPDGGMPLLETLRKQDRERALGGAAAAPPSIPETPAAPPPLQPGEAINIAEPVEETPPPPVSATTDVRPPAEAESGAQTAGAGPQAPAAEAKDQAEQRKVAGRVFVRTDYGWVEQSYKGEVLTALNQDSDEYRELLPTHPPLEKVAELGGTITLRIDGVWRDLKTGRPVAEPK
jgi:anti-sigma factor RsiW